MVLILIKGQIVYSSNQGAIIGWTYRVMKLL